MKFGTIEIARSIDSAVAHAQLAEQMGFDLFGIADSQSLYREAYVTAAMAGAATSRIQVGPTVTNFVTRHLAVTASAIGTVAEVTGGRAILGVASGDSAIYNIGEKPTRLAEMRGAVQSLHAMFRGETVNWKGADIHAQWVKRSIPIYIAAEGPRTLELAGEVADGVMCGMGLTPEAIALSLAHIEIGATRAGRTLDDIDVWVLARVNMGSDRNALIREIRMELASTAHHAFRFTLEGKAVPEHLHERIRAVQRGYNPKRHEALGESPNAKLMQDDELLEYMAERFAIVGDVAHCAHAIERLQKAGVNGILFSGFVDARAELLRNLGDVIAQVRQPCSAE
jgi:5,10-methylenetetrahydromethanopterin reductase